MSGGVPGRPKPEEIYLKDNVTYIPKMINPNLKKITIPSSVTLIDIAAFLSCANLQTIIYTGTIDQWCQIISIENTDSRDPENEDPWGILTGNNKIKIVVNGLELTGDLELPEGITKINDYAFYTIKIKSIKLPSTLKTIGKKAFAHCSLSGGLSIPDNVVNIGDSSFEGCSRLGKIILGNKLKTIGNKAFWDCGGTDNYIDCRLNIPISVTKIGWNAFYKKEIHFMDPSTYWYEFYTKKSIGQYPSNAEYYTSYPSTIIISENYAEE